MLEVKVKGTIPELSQLWDWQILCKLVHVDYYNRYMVPDDEIFIITHEDLSQAGLINPVD